MLREQRQLAHPTVDPTLRCKGYPQDRGSEYGRMNASQLVSLLKKFDGVAAMTSQPVWRLAFLLQDWSRRLR